MAIVVVPCWCEAKGSANEVETQSTLISVPPKLRDPLPTAIQLLEAAGSAVASVLIKVTLVIPSFILIAPPALIALFFIPLAVTVPPLNVAIPEIPAPPIAPPSPLPPSELKVPPSIVNSPLKPA